MTRSSQSCHSTNRDTAGGAPTQVVEYLYDLFNRRIAKNLDTDGDGTVDFGESYVYDGTDIVLDFVDADGEGITESPELAKRYLWGSAVDQLLAQEDATGTGTPADIVWPLTDHLGTVRDLVDSTAAPLTHYQYDTYGNITLGDTTLIRYLYTSQEYDLESGFYYYDARYYDPATGKLISEDPIGLNAGDANFYRYVGNNPWGAVDPDGLEPTEINRRFPRDRRQEYERYVEEIIRRERDIAKFQAMTELQWQFDRYIEETYRQKVGPCKDVRDLRLKMVAVSVGIDPSLVPKVDDSRGWNGISAWDAQFRVNLWKENPVIHMYPSELFAGKTAPQPTLQSNFRAYRTVLRKALEIYRYAGPPKKLPIQSTIRPLYVSAQDAIVSGWLATAKEHGIWTAIAMPGGMFDHGIIAAGGFAGRVSVPPIRMQIEVPLRGPSPLGSISGIPLGMVPKMYMNQGHLVDMEPARTLTGSTLNAFGEVRNANYFWRELLRREPQMFNNSNRYRIEELGLSPRVNDQWIQFTPAHQSLKGDVLHHHHIGHGRIAVPLPKTVHEQWTSQLH